MSQGDQTEQASSQKLTKARAEGQIARAKEFTTAICMIVGVSYFYMYGAELKRSIFLLFETAFTFDSTTIFDIEPSLELLAQSLFVIIKLFAPMMLFITLTAVGASSVLGGFNFNFKQISPKFSKINPASGIKRIFSKQTFVEFLKSVVKIAIILFLLYTTLNNNVGIISGLVRASFQTVTQIAFGNLITLVIMLISVAVIFGLIDVPYQKMTFSKQMMMSKEELKQEHKQQEGSPEVKGRRRQIQMQYARNSANKMVPTADVVLMNPTHYAVALKYDIEKAEAPFVVAKGKDEVAFYIRSLADKHEIEVLVVPEITRSIYHTTQVNQMVPNQLYLAVAQILKYVQQLQAWRKGQQAKPNRLPSFTIPENIRY